MSWAGLAVIITRSILLTSHDATMKKRDTRQRRAIRQVFLDAARPLTPEEVLERGQDEVPSLGLATVYRNVKILTEEGWLTEVALPQDGMRYELASRPHHHHFVCRTCDQAYDIHQCPPSVEEIAPAGFRVDDHEVILYGCCPACA